VDRYSVTVGFALIAMSLAYLRTDLTYDEAVYLQLSRTITEYGIPLRRAYDDFSRFRLFENSPPLVLYVASLSQMLFPRNEIVARLVHLAAFTLPTYVLVWWVARTRFGDRAALTSLLVLLAAPAYVQATTHVLLNVPLGLFATAALIAFHNASTSIVGRRWWLLAVALATALAVWTKYQSVCIVPAIIVYVTYVIATERSAGFRATRPPLVAIVIGGAAAVAALACFFWSLGGPAELLATLTHNAERIAPEPIPSGITRAMIGRAWRCQRTLGPVVLVFGAFALWGERRHRGLIVLLASYVAATIAFNVILFRLPGSGSSYLDSGVPALALLAGTGALRMFERAGTRAARAALACAAVAIQLADPPEAPFEPPRPNGSRIAAAYIAGHSRPGAGVMAETVAIEFYSDHPVRPISFTFPRELVLRSLEGTSGDDISFVVVEVGVAPKNIDSIRDRWNRLIAEHFELVPAGAPGLEVYRRR